MASVHSEEAPIADRNSVKTVLVSLFLCIEKLEKIVGLNLSRKLYVSYKFLYIGQEKCWLGALLHACCHRKEVCCDQN